MSAHAVASEMRAEIRRYRNKTRVGGPEECLVAKDAFCAAIDQHLAKLMRAIGTVEKQTFGSNGESTKRVPFTVARKVRPARKVLTIAA